MSHRWHLRLLRLTVKAKSKPTLIYCCMQMVLWTTDWFDNQQWKKGICETHSCFAGRQDAMDHPFWHIAARAHDELCINLPSGGFWVRVRFLLSSLFWLSASSPQLAAASAIGPVMWGPCYFVFLTPFSCLDLSMTYIEPQYSKSLNCSVTFSAVSRWLFTPPINCRSKHTIAPIFGLSLSTKS